MTVSMQPEFQPFGQQPAPQPAPQQPIQQPVPQPVAPQPAPMAMPGMMPQSQPMAPQPYPQQPAPIGPTPPQMPQISGHNKGGYHGKWFVIGLIAIILAVIAFGVAGWSYYTYQDNKNTIDEQVEVAEAAARKEQADKDAADFTEKEKQPNREFAGPDDFGRLSFNYPKTWSVYVGTEAGTAKPYEAYLHPITVPPVSVQQQFALRVTIEQVDYDKEIATYDAAVKKGDLKTSAVTINGAQGTRLDGIFSKDIRGSAVIFKIRDKVVTMRCDADTFKGDFDTIISTITFNA